MKKQKEILSSQLSEKQSAKNELQQAIDTESNKEKQHYVTADLLEKNAEYTRLIGEVKNLKAEIQQPDTSELRQKKAIINRDIDELKKQLYIKTTAEAQKKRIQELEAELKTLSQELATLEGKEFIADKFNRA